MARELKIIQDFYDFIVFSKDRETLVDVRVAVKEYLNGIRLKLHANKSFIRPVKAGLTFVGMRIWRDHRLLKKSSIKLFKKRIKWMKKAYESGLIDNEHIRQRLMSWAGHCGQTDSSRLLSRLSKDWRFQRAALE